MQIHYGSKQCREGKTLFPLTGFVFLLNLLQKPAGPNQPVDDPIASTPKLATGGATSLQRQYRWELPEASTSSSHVTVFCKIFDLIYILFQYNLNVE